MPAGYGGGFERVLLGFYDSTTGANIGQSPTLSNGSASGAFVLSDVNEGQIAFEDATVLDFNGGDRNRGRMIFGAASRMGQFDITVSSDDTDIVAAVTGSTVNTTNTEFTKFSYNPNRSTTRNMWVALQQRYLFSTGVEGYRTVFLPKCSVQYRPGGMSFRGESNAVLRVLPNLSTTFITGQTFGTGSTGLSLGLEENKSDHLFWYSDNPIYVVTLKGNAVATTATAAYLPLSSTVTLNATPNEMVLAGTPTALSSVNTSTGVLTWSSAPGNGVHGVVIYETAYVPSS